MTAMSYGGLDLETHSILHDTIALAWSLIEYCSVTVLDYWVFLDVAKTNFVSHFSFCLFVCVSSIFCITSFGADCTVHNTTKLPVDHYWQNLSTASILKNHLMSTEVHSCLL